jgi:hypothetical protein
MAVSAPASLGLAVIASDEGDPLVSLRVVSLLMQPLSVCSIATCVVGVAITVMAGGRGRVPTEQFARDDDAEMCVKMLTTRIRLMGTSGELHLLRWCEYGIHTAEEARSVSRLS